MYTFVWLAKLEVCAPINVERGKRHCSSVLSKHSLSLGTQHRGSHDNLLNCRRKMGGICVHISIFANR